MSESNPPLIHTAGPPLPPELNHDLLTQVGWLIGNESDAVLRWHRRLTDSSDRTWDEYWDAILGILNHSGVLSRVFWPATNPACSRTCCLAKEKPADRAKRERMAVRGTFLRTLFDIADGSPLNEDGRRARNTIEHWDERLDGRSWFEDISAAKGGYKLWIGSLTDVPASSYPVRAYDPDADVIACGETRMPLLPLVKEARRIERRYAQVVGFMAHGDPIWSYAAQDAGHASR